MTFAQLRCEMLRCQECSLHRHRCNVVTCNGRTTANIMLIGEAPGATEDKLGYPFCGRSGEYMWQIFRDAGLDPALFFVTNMLKCRPPGNRRPKPKELVACRPWLDRQIELLQPRLIVTCGGTAYNELVGGPVGVMAAHGHLFFLPSSSSPFYVMFHPAAAARRRQSWGRQFISAAVGLREIIKEYVS